MENKKQGLSDQKQSLSDQNKTLIIKIKPSKTQKNDLKIASKIDLSIGPNSPLGKTRNCYMFYNGNFM